MELEKKNPEFQDLSPKMDALLLTDDTIAASGALGAKRKNPK